MSDEGLIAKIDETVQALNALLREATAARIEFDVELLDITTLSDPVEAKTLVIDRFRKIKWL